MKKSFDSFKKSPYQSVKHSTYFDIYDQIFSKYIGKKITFVEVGILDGGSLFMWRDFFGPNARIIGIEFNPDGKKWEKFGFEIFIGDQSDKNFWNKTLSKIGHVDILLDDGGHTFEQQIVTVEESINSINDGGMIVVEDTHTSYMKDYGGPSNFSFINYAKKKIDKCNYRFSLFNKTKNYDKSIFSISFFESFVIFNIDRLKVNKKSELLKNLGKKISSKDYRDKSSPIVDFLNNQLFLIKHDKLADNPNFFSIIFYKFFRTILKIILKSTKFLRRMVFNIKNIKLFF